MYRVSLVTVEMEFLSQNFPDRGEAETFILEMSEKKKIKNCRLKNLDTGEEEKVEI